MNPLRIGIVGFGRIGAEHAAWIARVPELRLAGAVDPTAARRDLALRLGLSASDDLGALLDDPSVDAVLIATPTAMHFEQATAALAAGKHVMIEKPMALNAQQAQRLIEQARRADRVLSVFHNRRWDADYLAVVQAIRGGVFGRVINVESRLGQWGSCVGPAAPEYRPNWRNEQAFGGGGLFDWGSHFVDQLWRLLWPARPLRVFAQLRGNVWSRDCDDLARVLIDFEGGAVGLVEINTTTTRPLPRWHIDGTGGSGSAPFSPDFAIRRWAELDFTPAGSSESRRLQGAAPGLDEAAIWRQFAASTRGAGVPAVSAPSVLPTMRLLDAARESSAAGAAVSVDASEWTL